MHLIASVENKNVTLANFISNLVWKKHSLFLQNTQGLSSYELQNHPQINEIYQTITEPIEGLTILKVKIYDLTGKTVFSTNRLQIGERESDNTGFLRAREGKTFTKLEHRDFLNVIGRRLRNRQALSTYVPIINQDSSQEVVGVIEIYSDVTALITAIDLSQKHIISTISIILSLLYLFLFVIVKRADKLIKRQHLALDRSQKSQAAAEMANQAKSEFIANMSHELRTPLNAVLGFTQLMNRDSSLSLRQKEYLNIISHSGEHLLSLINDVLNLAKIESGHMSLNLSNFDFYRLLQGIEKMLRLKVEKKGLKLIIEDYSGLPRYLKADEQKLRQVLINLLNNAIKFTVEGTVRLRFAASLWESESIRIECEIEDTGRGVSSQQLANIFQPFVQDSENPEFQEGTGLGLAISQKFINLMGGDIIMSSTVNKGTIVKFDFVARRGKIEAESSNLWSSRKVIGLPENLPDYRILVVDDCWENREMLCQLLESVGFKVDRANNGREAVELWSSWQPHLIWMDIRMPIMDGYEATKQIRSRPNGRDLIIIALTASAFDEQQSLALSAGCNDFIHKPFREDIIWQKMSEHLGVSYLYQEEKLVKLKNSDPEIDNLILQSEALQIMSSNWIADLERAAIELNEELIVQLIKQIPDEHSLLAEALRNIIDNFDFGQILELTQKK